MSTKSDSIDASAPRPRLCRLRKWSYFQGYGFNLHAEKTRNGQFIGKVDANSPAEAAGLKEKDRIIEVNFVNISNENHQQVVKRIRNGLEFDGKIYENEVVLLVVDEECDNYYKKLNKVVKNDMESVLRLETPPENGQTTDNKSSPANTPSSTHKSIDSAQLPPPPPVDTNNNQTNHTATTISQNSNTKNSSTASTPTTSDKLNHSNNSNNNKVSPPNTPLSTKSSISSNTNNNFITKTNETINSNNNNNNNDSSSVDPFNNKLLKQKKRVQDIDEIHRFSDTISGSTATPPAPKKPPRSKAVLIDTIMAASNNHNDINYRNRMFYSSNSNNADGDDEEDEDEGFERTSIHSTNNKYFHERESSIHSDNSVNKRYQNAVSNAVNAAGHSRQTSNSSNIDLEIRDKGIQAVREMLESTSIKRNKEQQQQQHHQHKDHHIDFSYLNPLKLSSKLKKEATNNSNSNNKNDNDSLNNIESHYNSQSRSTRLSDYPMYEKNSNNSSNNSHIDQMIASTKKFSNESTSLSPSYKSPAPVIQFNSNRYADDFSSSRERNLNPNERKLDYLLQMSASEFKNYLKNKQKQDPRAAQVDMKQKYQLFQNM